MIGITASVVAGAVFIFCIWTYSLTSSDTLTAGLIEQLPSMLVVGGITGFTAGFTRSNGCLVMISAALGWILGASASAIAVGAFQLPRNLGFIVQVSLGVLIGVLPSVIVDSLKRGY